MSTYVFLLTLYHYAYVHHGKTSETCITNFMLFMLFFDMQPPNVSFMCVFMTFFWHHKHYVIPITKPPYHSLDLSWKTSHNMLASMNVKQMSVSPRMIPKYMYMNPQNMSLWIQKNARESKTHVYILEHESINTKHISMNPNLA